MSGFERKGGIDGLPAVRLGYLTDEASWDGQTRMRSLDLQAEPNVTLRECSGRHAN